MPNCNFPNFTFFNYTQFILDRLPGFKFQFLFITIPSFVTSLLLNGISKQDQTCPQKKIKRLLKVVSRIMGRKIQIKLALKKMVYNCNPVFSYPRVQWFYAQVRQTSLTFGDPSCEALQVVGAPDGDGQLFLVQLLTDLSQMFWSLLWPNRVAKISSLASKVVRDLLTKGKQLRQLFSFLFY